MKILFAIVGLAVVTAGCGLAPGVPQPPGSAPAASSPAAAGPAATAPAAAAPGVDATVTALQQQNAALQATLTAQQSQGQVAAAQQTNTALQTAVAKPKPPEPKPAEAKPAEPKPAEPKPAAAEKPPAPPPPPPPPAPPTAAPKPASKGSASGGFGIGRRAELEVTVDGAHIRSGPAEEAPELGSALRAGERLQDAEAQFGSPLEGDLRWWRVRHPTESGQPRGFIHNSQVREIP